MRAGPDLLQGVGLTYHYSPVAKPPAGLGRLTFGPGIEAIWQVDEEVPMIERLKLYDWTFSATAEAELACCWHC
jgi:hypothetical protein